MRLLVEDEGMQSEGNEVSELSGVNWAGKDKRAAEELVCCCRIPSGTVTTRTDRNMNMSVALLVTHY